MLAYTTCGFAGATCTATRPHGFAGSPLLLLTSLQWAPPSVDSNSPLPGPPERNVQPCRRKSHIAAKMVFGSCLLRAIMAQPLEPFTPARTFFQVLPPSFVWKTPRSSLSSHKCPVAQTSTLLLSFGFTKILAMCSLFFRPTLVQFSPPSVDL